MSPFPPLFSMRLFFSSLFFIVIVSTIDAESLPLPNPVPPLGQNRIDKVLPVLETTTIPLADGHSVELPTYVAGNKEVSLGKAWGSFRNPTNSEVRFHNVTILIDGEFVGNLMWWGSQEQGNFGYPFKNLDDDPPTVEIDHNAKISYYKKPYRTAQGEKAVFTLTLTPLQDSRIEIAWDTGSSAKIAPWWMLPGSFYRDKKIVLGDNVFVPAAFDKFKDGKVPQVRFSGSNLDFHSDHPAGAYRIELGGPWSGNMDESVVINEKINETRFDACYRMEPTGEAGQKGKIVLDLGNVTFPNVPPRPPVRGIDFWKADLTHVPLLPSRNIMPNPSFEQGLRYWRWVGGGATYVPGPEYRYDIVADAQHGKKALIIRSCTQGANLQSFPLSLDPEKKYTLSFYGKTLTGNNSGMRATIGNASAVGGSYAKDSPYPLVHGDTASKDSQFTLTGEWQRYWRTFPGDAAGVIIRLSGNDILIDAIQLEEGDKPSDFVSSPIEGCLTTSDSDNDLYAGTAIDAAFEFFGKPGTDGSVALTVENAFREVLFSSTLKIKIGDEGVQKCPLELDANKLGLGVFLVKTEYRVPGFEPYGDYYRFAIKKPLENKHATKNIFGTLLGDCVRLSRGEDFARKMMEWGWGSTSWMPFHSMNDPLYGELMRKYRFKNMHTPILDAVDHNKNLDPSIWLGYRKLLAMESVSPELVQLVEEEAFRLVQSAPSEFLPYVAFGNEEESHPLTRANGTEEYFKLQHATAKGAKRARPDIGVTPTSGTSGYSPLRGFDRYEQYLAVAQKHGFKYDAITVHPYGNIDKGTISDFDQDEETARLIEQMGRYGYGKETPILFTEGFLVDAFSLSQWAKGGKDMEMPCGKPTYDFGRREFLQAAGAARLYIICLKYWPHVQSFNIWIHRPFLDLNFAPLLLCPAVNTLGHLMDDVVFHANIRPFADIRGYSFTRKDGTAVAALWTTNHAVENGIKPNPTLQVRFDQPVKMVDFMGNLRTAKTNPDGTVTIPVTPAPLYLLGKDAEKLTQSLQNAERNDEAVPNPLRLSLLPSPSGGIVVQLKNDSGKRQSGTLLVGKQEFSFKLEGNTEQQFSATRMTEGKSTGKMYKVDTRWKITFNDGPVVEGRWNMHYFYVPKTSGMPDWKRISPIPIENYVSEIAGEEKTGAKVDASFRVAWDKQNLYLKVEVVDPQFLLFPELWKEPESKTRLTRHDGSLEVYFDTGANGLFNDAAAYDMDDYRYDFSVGPNGARGLVYRHREVYEQLADGINMPSKQEAAEKILCEFLKTKEGYEYSIIIPQRYIEPIVLREGFLSGFALCLHDFNRNAQGDIVRGTLSTATEPGSSCDANPKVWPLMILAE